MLRFSFLNRLGSLRAISTAGSILAPIVDRGLVPYPYMMMFVTTRRCNSHCRMCNIWQDRTSSSLSVDQINYIFSRNDFSFLRSLALTGGEPTLRPDLPEILEIIGTYCRNLELIQLATNGLIPSQVATQVSRMLTWVDEKLKSVYRFDIQVSLDGIGEVHDWVRGIPGAFQRVLETLDRLIALRSSFPRLGIRLSTVVVPYNLPYLTALQAFALERKLPISFSPVILSNEYYGNLQSEETLSFSVNQNAQAAELFKCLAQREQSGLRYYYGDVSRMLLGKPRRRRCMMGFYGFVLEHNGIIYPCVNCELHSWGNLIDTPFKEIWFGPQATLFRHRMVQECCQRCTSLCYPLAANAFEVIDLAIRRIRSHLRHYLMPLNH